MGEPRSLEFLVNTYYASIGSGAVLILSPAPDPTGVFPARQVERLGAFRKWIDGSFRDNLLRGAQGKDPFPYGDMLAVPLEDVTDYRQTSGTTGKPGTRKGRCMRG